MVLRLKKKDEVWQPGTKQWNNNYRWAKPPAGFANNKTKPGAVQIQVLLLLIRVGGKFYRGIGFFDRNLGFHQKWYFHGKRSPSAENLDIW